MERPGWTLKNPSAAQHVLEKTIRDGWILRKIGWSRGYELERRDECKLVFADWEWADWDRQRLVWTEAGCLRATTLGSHDLGPAAHCTISTGSTASATYNSI